MHRFHFQKKYAAPTVHRDTQLYWMSIAETKDLLKSLRCYFLRFAKGHVADLIILLTAQAVI